MMKRKTQPMTALAKALILKLSGFTLLALLAPTAQASSLNEFQGRWEGSGSATWYSPASSREMSCSLIYFHLNAPRSDLFEIIDGGYSCDDDLEANYPNSQFELRGNQLFYNGKKVGNLDANGISIQIIDKEEGYAFDFELVPAKQEGQPKMFYSEKWRELNSNVPGTLKLSIQGQLELK